ncbi:MULTISPECIES: DUF6489 family protein [Sphingomonas]|uniref:DUF6489 family protein n=1 Tax=Sphingomonas kyungheensis TaxID=1069987 RepID=A0ABU8H520_9SPHN|nr:DUF6489 family protein [Sphingomonas sp. RIT328]EZP49206.1 hypothetical protein BW41_03486 [Sphingomonas sp. RIT328]
MKLTVNVDLTPEEARRAMGLPDLTPLHDRYVASLLEAMNGQVRPELLENLMRSWSPMGDASVALWRQVFDQATGAGGKSGS